MSTPDFMEMTDEQVVRLAQDQAGAALEFQIRELAWWSCVNWIADAIGRCEVRTYREGEEIREREYYLWNVEPNVNQNSTAFWHKAVARLFQYARRARPR